MNAVRGAAALAVALAVVVPQTAAADPRPTATLTYVSGSPVTFWVADMTQPAMKGRAVAFTLAYTTSRRGGGGSLVVTPPGVLSGLLGMTLSTRDVSASCVQTGGFGRFVSLGIVRLNGPTTCATLPPNASGTVNVDVTLYLDDTARAPAPFASDVFLPGALLLAVTVT